MSSNSNSNVPETVSEWLELKSFADAEEGLDDALLRDLYRHARGEDGSREMLTTPPFVRGWVSLDSKGARELIAVFLSDDEERDPKRGRYVARTNLEAVAWNDRLAIEEPPLAIRIKIHGTKWGMRFESTAPAMKGKERVNEELPSLRAMNKVSEHEAPPTSRIDPAKPVTIDPLAADVLRAGGMPA